MIDEYTFLLNDRITKIKSMNELYDLEHQAYISFSGGKDSTVLSALIDIAIPDNTIPRVYINTGIEYKMVADFVGELHKNDRRIHILTPSQNIKQILENYGYPFKSKEHSLYVSVFQNSGETKTVKRYLNRGNKYECPAILKYQFTDNFNLKVSNKCCYKLKKEPADKWRIENGKTVTITGMRSDEGGLRASLKGCAVFDGKDLKKFHPLQPIESWWIDEFIKRNNIKLCELYYPPYNFTRTGCKGCPYSVNLQSQLDVMSVLLPAEKKQCEYIWKPVYDEYRRINYRLENQPSLFE